MKSLDFGNMKEALLYADNQEEMDDIWDAIHMMYVLDFIDRDTWRKFYEECGGWYVDEENNCVRDCHRQEAHRDVIVWEYRRNK